MKVAYVFNTSGRTATYQLGKMILPQLESGTLGVEVAAMLFFDDNNFILRKGDAVRERLAKVVAEKNILLVSCSQCSMERGLSRGICCGEDACTTDKPDAVDCVEGVACGCWADFFAITYLPVRTPGWNRHEQQNQQQNLHTTLRMLIIMICQHL